MDDIDHDENLMQLKQVVNERHEGKKLDDISRCERMFPKFFIVCWSSKIAMFVWVVLIFTIKMLVSK